MKNRQVAQKRDPGAKRGSVAGFTPAERRGLGQSPIQMKEGA